MTAPVAQALSITRLTCRAPHSDPKKKGQPCGSILGDIPGDLEYVTNAEKAPHEPDGFIWLRCPRENCRRWNKWQLTTAPALPEGSIEERLARFPEDQQQAILALAGGIKITAAADTIGVDRRTVNRWKDNPEFMALRREIAPALSSAHIRIALDALFDLIEKDRKKGSGTHIRYFLNRTLFAEFEKDRAAKAGTAINLNVAQHQQQTQATVKGVWEERQRIVLPAPLAPTE